MDSYASKKLVADMPSPPRMPPVPGLAEAAQAWGVACRIRQHPAAPANTGINWWHSDGNGVAYDDAVQLMEAQVRAIRNGSGGEAVWLLQHQPVYTGGRSADSGDVLATTSLAPIRHSNRGGQWTYHAPGQRVIYIMLDVAKYGHDVRAFVRAIEEWGIVALASFGIKGRRRSGLPGIWLAKSGDGKDDELEKIAAIGIRLSRWVSYHGMAINVSDEVLAGFAGIVPCGVADAGVTSLSRTTHNKNSTGLMQQLDTALMASFAHTIGRL